jgi:hypothetical protein
METVRTVEGAEIADPCGSSRFAIVIGILLLVEGIWGLTNPVVFGVLTTNRLHAAVHIALGVAGLAFGLGGAPRAYELSLGVLLLGVGCLRLVPGIGDVISRLLNVNHAVAFVNILVGVASLVAARIRGIPPVGRATA